MNGPKPVCTSATKKVNQSSPRWLRRDAAIEYLARPDMTLLDIADQLGFSEASTFHRAFKKWTGVAPGAYRQRERESLLHSKC